MTPETTATIESLEACIEACATCITACEGVDGAEDCIVSCEACVTACTDLMDTMGGEEEEVAPDDEPEGGPVDLSKVDLKKMSPTDKTALMDKLKKEAGL